MTRKISRRQFLIVSGATVSSSVLAACASSDDQGAVEAPAAEPAVESEPAVPGSKYQEAPQLADMVRSGDLPPVDERLPLQPWVIEIKDSIGKYGGKLSSVVADPTANLFEISNARAASLARRSPDFSSIVPFVVESWELSADSMKLTVNLRQGMRWSDGEPFTTADVQFWYEDVLLNEEITPVIDDDLAPGGEPMILAVEDDFTFSFNFAVPYPTIVDILPSQSPWLPKHYLSQWHINHNENANDLAADENFDTWFEAFLFHADVAETQQDVDMPVLGAWQFASQDTQGNTLYTRNPYYWAIDPDGNQLPYVDEIEKLTRFPLLSRSERRL